MAPVFLFSALQVLIYFGAIVAVLYYWGVMQMVLKKVAWFMRFTLGTTATESLAACANTLLGMSEGPLLIRPYLEKMTASELHAICTSGFSCIAGSLFSAYISFGACPNYLMAASILSAPGSLAFSKLLYPETKKSQLKEVKDLELEKPTESNVIECLSNGAASMVGVVFAIGANLVVFNALMALLDDIINYIGSLIGYNGWSFQIILGYIFFPLAYIMGVTANLDETLRVAQLMGTKTAVNEFVAYQKLGEMTSAGLLSARSAMIATYSLCSFANFGSVGIQLELLGSMAPSQKPVLSKIIMQALLAGSVSSFYTATIAGILIDSPTLCLPKNNAGSCFDPNKFINQTISTTTNSIF
ncbi:hypothetical protein WR25_08883 [Diploscapter pachys]|uniref:Uncharacterized protein n=1 Tax=Diploscapter pachys TaxID=2018661 RepID=A0A2A2JB91_9BILA|nr:hypothetical protein WR25_08883 [Diploscapter pachys]